MFNGKSYNEYMLPKLHQLNLKSYNNIICSLICYQYPFMTSSTLQPYQYNFMRQPKLMIYDPYVDKINIEQKVGKDNVKITSTRDLTFIDYLDESSVKNFMTKENYTYKLNSNVYAYNEKSYYSEYDDMKSKINSFTNRIKLLEFINELFGEDNEANISEDTENQFTLEHMKQYAISRYLPFIAYKKNDMYLLRTVGEEVVNETNGKFTAIGEQPTGDYVDISSNKVNNKIFDDRNQTVVDILYIFKIEDPYFNITKSDYKLYDEEKNDISANSLIIIGNIKYVYQNNEWVRIR